MSDDLRLTQTRGLKRLWRLSAYWMEQNWAWFRRYRWRKRIAAVRRANVAMREVTQAFNEAGQSVARFLEVERATRAWARKKGTA